MANLRHGSFSHSRPPPAPCHLINRSQYHLALESQPLCNEIDCHCSEENEIILNPQAKQYFPQIPEISHQTILLKQLQEVLNLCSVFTQELNILCGIGAKTAHCLTAVLKELLLNQDTPFQNLGDFPNPQEMAGHFLETWDQLALATSGAVAAVQQGVFATLQEATSTIESNHKTSGEENNTTTSNQIAVTCLWAMIQLQLQFSLSFNKSLSTFSGLMPQDTETLSNFCGLKKDVKIVASEPLKNCIESIIGIHRYFSSVSHNVNSKSTSSSHIELGLNNHECQSNKSVELDSKLSIHKENQCYRRWSVNGTHQYHHHNSNIDNKYMERHLQRRWSVPGPHPYRGLWDPGPSIQSLDKASVGDQISSDTKLVGSLASTEELQEVINLLSCQPSNPPSPTSESSLSFSTLNQVGFESHLSVWPAVQLTEGSGQNQRDSNDVTERDSSSVQFVVMDSARRTGTWPRTSGNTSIDVGIWGWLPNKDCVPGNSPDVAETTKLFRLPQDHSELLVENIVNHPLTPSHSTLKLQRTFAPTGNNSVASVDVSHLQHPPATKSISWPVSTLQIQRGCSGQADSGSSSDEASTNNGPSAKNSFFMGLDLVGSDLMASVRQRRHSSSGTFSERSQDLLQNPSYTSTSSRTKSIDNISIEDTVTKSRTSTWPLKLPNVPVSQINFQPGEKMLESLLPNTSLDWLPSDSALGLPPSGAEGRTRHKPERKYSLFGQIS